MPLELDVLDEASVGRAVERTKAHFGGLDVIVNNAGYGQLGAVEELTDAEARQNFDVNVFGPLNVLRAALALKFKYLKSFLTAVPQYAIWDDHDFGPNDAGKDWRLKDTALNIFKHFWPNDYPAQEAFNGNYFSYRYYDSEFFMLDNRFFREEPCDSCAFLGETQIIWLKNKLMQSDATFKFIAIGSQVLNANGFGESFDEYKKEQTGLIDFITKNNINGVVFLTGDKHYSEICKREQRLS